MFYIGVTGFQIDKVLQPSLVTDRQTDWLADPVAAGRHTDGQTDGLCIADLYGLKQPSSPNPQIKAWDLTLDDWNVCTICPLQERHASPKALES